MGRGQPTCREDKRDKLNFDSVPSSIVPHVIACRQVATHKHCVDSISVVRFCADGSKLAVGSRDTFIDIYAAAGDYPLVTRCMGLGRGSCGLTHGWAAACRVLVEGAPLLAVDALLGG